MNRIPPLDPASATGRTKQLLDGVQARLGAVPNLFRVLGNSSAALDGYLQFSAALARGVVDAKVREQIALAVAEANACGYCLSAHAFIGAKAGLSEAEVADARRAQADAAKTDAMLKLARSVVVHRGDLADGDIATARAAGVTDVEIVEIVANVALNVLTNYVNHVARTVVDFPELIPGAIDPVPATRA
jgi:uncharacterized peroxidase-related enzyme